VRLRLLVVALIVMILPFAAVPAAAGENPHNVRCERVGVVNVVCAGADGGGAVGCMNVTPAEVSCEFTLSWNLRGYSPAAIPGDAAFSWEYAVVACFDNVVCLTDTSGGGSASCSWVVPLADCRESDRLEGTRSYALALGQCVVLSLWVQVETVASIPLGTEPLYEAEVAQLGEGAGAGCHLDDGRD
jgi:hypothetical protein